MPHFESYPYGQSDSNEWFAFARRALTGIRNRREERRVEDEIVTRDDSLSLGGNQLSRWAIIVGEDGKMYKILTTQQVKDIKLGAFGRWALIGDNFEKGAA